MNCVVTTRVGSKADEYFQEAKCHRILVQSKRNQAQVFFEAVSSQNLGDDFNQKLIDIFKKEIPNELKNDLIFTKKYFQLLLQKQTPKGSKNKALAFTMSES